MEKWILCKHKGYVLNVIVPETSNKYRFHLERPLLIKNKEDIEYFLSEDNYVEVEAPEVITDKLEVPKESGQHETPQKEPEEKDEVYGEPILTSGVREKDLRKLTKSKLRKILKELAPEKDSPVKKENIINLILELQESK